MPRIDEMFAFVADEGGGDEGVVATHTGAGWMPLVGADMNRVDSLRPLAEELARITGREIRLIKFTNREDLDVLSPLRKKP